MTGPAVNFCCVCGAKISSHIIPADNRPRFACTECDYIHYENPKVLVSVLIAHEDKILLCKRADPPAQGRWAPPGGFMESNETLEEAAAREVQEETGVELAPERMVLHALSSLPQISEIYVGFHTTVDTPIIQCGEECLEVRFFDQADIPWDELAYPEIAGYLHLFFREKDEGRHSIHVSTLNGEGVVRQGYSVQSAEKRYSPSAPVSDVGLNK